MVLEEVKTIPNYFRSPYGLTALADGIVLVASFATHQILKIVPQGILIRLFSLSPLLPCYSVASLSLFSFSPFFPHFNLRTENEKYEVIAIIGSVEGKEDGSPEKCRLNGPTGITYDERTNTCYVSDFGNHCIRKFSLL